MSNKHDDIFTEEEQQQVSHIISRNNYFGFSQEDDEFVASSDLITVPYYAHQDPVYHYEKLDKTATLKSMIEHYLNLKKRLVSEPDIIKVKRIQTILKNNEFIFLREKEHIEKQMKMNIAQIISDKTL